MQSGGVRIVLKGGLPEFSSGLNHGTNTKGLVVEEGGLLEMHGKKFAPTWTRLSTTAMKGSSQLQLIDDVNWEAEQELVPV